MGGSEVEAFLNHLASEKRLSASSQTQAFNALVFLYDSVLLQPLGKMTGLNRAQRGHRVPVVLAREEVKAILEQMSGVVRLMAELLYGSGLRVNECMTLRVKDIDFASGVLNVRSGKGGKDRTTLLPERLHAPLKQQIIRVAEQHKKDLLHGAGLAPLPCALARKYPSASNSLAWQFVFPSAVLWFCLMPSSALAQSTLGSSWQQ